MDRDQMRKMMVEFGNSKEFQIMFNAVADAMKVAVDEEVRRRLLLLLGGQTAALAPQPAPAPIVAPKLPTASVAANKVVRSQRYRPIEPKPCPVTGILNKNRRFHYLMPEVRTVENLQKYHKHTR